jgi:membrane protein implicated in regulation of membrane protease activity
MVSVIFNISFKGMQQIGLICSMIDDRQRSQIGRFTGVMLLVLGLFVTPVGLLGFLSEGFSGIGMVLLILTISGLLIAYGGWQQIRASRTLQQDEQKLHQELNETATPAKVIAGTPAAQTNKEVLAQWETDAHTWKAFVKNERNYRNSDNIYYFIGVVLLGTPFLMLARAVPWTGALVFSAVFGLLIVYLRRSLSLKKLQPRSGQVPGQVVIGKGYVVLNGHTFDLYSESRHTTRVQFLPDQQPAILEFTIAWITRKGRTFDELRVPVPQNQMEKAKEVVKYFNN